MSVTPFPISRGVNALVGVWVNGTFAVAVAVAVAPPVDGSSLRIKRCLGFSLGMKMEDEGWGEEKGDGVNPAAAAAKKSAGLFVVARAAVLDAERDRERERGEGEGGGAPALGLSFPPRSGVNDRGVMRLTGLGGPEEGGARRRGCCCVSPTLYSGNGVTFGGSGSAPYGPVRAGVWVGVRPICG